VTFYIAGRKRSISSNTLKNQISVRAIRAGTHHGEGKKGRPHPWEKKNYTVHGGFDLLKNLAPCCYSRCIGVIKRGEKRRRSVVREGKGGRHW